MATGDSHATAEAVARELGIDEFRAGVSPEDKAELVAALQAKGHAVAMAGDGVKGDLRGIVRARVLARATLENIRQNLFFAFVYNAIGVPVAAGILYPVFGLLLSPMIAAAAMSLSSVSVIGNALRLRRLAL